MQAAIEHENGVSMNPGGAWIAEAMSDLNVDEGDFNEMTGDEKTLWEYRVHCRAWELRNADEQGESLLSALRTRR